MVYGKLVEEQIQALHSTFGAFFLTADHNHNEIDYAVGGDSGGPVFLEKDGVYLLEGITSYLHSSGIRYLPLRAAPIGLSRY